MYIVEINLNYLEAALPDSLRSAFRIQDIDESITLNLTDIFDGKKYPWVVVGRVVELADAEIVIGHIITKLKELGIPEE